MTRLVLAIVALAALSGCQHSGQQAIDPFWGRTTVPSPATGSIGSPGCPQPLQPPIVTQGTPIPSGGLQPTTQPNLLPAPISPAPTAPATGTPMPVTPAPGGSAVPYGGASAIPAPPSGNSTPGVAPPSGYSGAGASPWGTPGSPAATMPGSSPTDRYGPSPASPTRPGSLSPPAGGPSPASPSSFSPPNAPATPAPAGAPPAGYFPPNGYNYDNRNGSTRPSTGDNWVTPGGVATARPGVPGTSSLDGAIVSAPPETTIRPGVSGTPGLDAGPSIVRIPTGGDGGSMVTPASADSR